MGTFVLCIFPPPQANTNPSDAQSPPGMDSQPPLYAPLAFADTQIDLEESQVDYTVDLEESSDDLPSPRSPSPRSPRSQNSGSPISPKELSDLFSADASDDAPQSPAPTKAVMARLLDAKAVIVS